MMASTSTGRSPPIPSRSTSHESGGQPHVRCARRRPTQESPGNAFPGLLLTVSRVVSTRWTTAYTMRSRSLSLWLPLQKRKQHTRAREGFGVAYRGDIRLVFADVRTLLERTCRTCAAHGCLDCTCKTNASPDG